MDAPLTLNRGKSPADMWSSSSIHTHPNRGSSNTATCRASAPPPPPPPPLRLALPEGPRLACPLGPLGPLDGPRLAFAPAPAPRDAAAACPRSRKLIGVAADHTRAVEGLSAWSCHTARSSNNRPSNEPPGGGGAVVGMESMKREEEETRIGGVIEEKSVERPAHHRRYTHLGLPWWTACHNIMPPDP